MLLRRDSGGSRDVFRASIWGWKYGQACPGGESVAEAVRLEALAWAATVSGAATTSAMRWEIIEYVLQYGYPDAAVASLDEWAPRVDTSDFENSNDNRTDSRSLLSCQLTFLEDRNGSRHAAAARIATQARALGALIHPELSLELRRRWGG